MSLVNIWTLDLVLHVMELGPLWLQLILLVGIAILDKMTLIAT